MPHAPAKGTQIHPRSSHFGVYSDLTFADVHVAADPPVNVALYLYQGYMYVYVSLCMYNCNWHHPIQFIMNYMWVIIVVTLSCVD